MRRSFIISTLFGLVWQCNAAVLVRGNKTEAPFGFNAPIHAFAFDELSGSVYVGLNDDTITFNEYALSYATRPSFSAPLQFIGIATDDAIKNKSINLLALASGSNQSPIALCVRSLEQANIVGVSTAFITTSTTDTILEQTTTTQTNITAVSDDLNDASGITTTSGIIALTTNVDTAFAAVKGTGNFGIIGSNSGITLVQVIRGISTLELSTVNSQTGAAGNAATPLTANSPAITGSTAPVTFLNGPDANQVALFFDTILNLVYAGIRIQTGTAVGNIGKAVVIGEVSSTGALILKDIVLNSALDANNRIVAALVNMPNQPAPLSIKAVSVLHASTGPDYLIVNGSEGTTSMIGNKIRALPLVNNPGNPTHGILADKNSSLDPERHVFTVPATTSAGLVLDSDDVAMVGAGELPLEAHQNIASMFVVGDTVYVSSSVSNNANNNAGIFYSRAQFDKSGKILCWTPWTRRALPYNAFPDSNLSDLGGHDGKVNQCAIDARTGSTWFVEGNTNKNVGITTWTLTNGATGLISTLNTILPKGCYTVLDLDQSTRGFVKTPYDRDFQGYRYALFGGKNTIIFTIISKSEQTDLLDGTQIIETEFGLPETTLITQLPEGAGCLQCLEYSRQTSDEGNQNYFFAGTDTGLFVFTNDAQEGFSVDNLNILDQPPFTTRSWRKVNGITGSVVQLKTNGKKLYIMTQESTAETPFKATIISASFATTVPAMFATQSIIAQTGVGIFENVLQFFDLALIATGTTVDQEQLVLATNNGLFFSDNSTGVNQATNQTQANWQLLANTEKTLFNGIGQANIQPQHTIWPFSMEDLSNKKTFTRSSIHQLSGNDNTTVPFTAFMPTAFNAYNNPLFKTLDHMYSFWSDGARRFFITQPLQYAPARMNLAILPFNTQEWNANSLFTLSYGPLAQIKNFYWIQDIGASGMILAGTNTGVVALA